MTRSKELGDAGERVAEQYLRAEGFEILDRNWRSGRYELDIVARRDGRLHLVEVKCRRKGSLTPPEQGLTPAKRRTLLAAGAVYMDSIGTEAEVQTDLIAVEAAPDGDFEVRYIPEAVIARW